MGGGQAFFFSFFTVGSEGHERTRSTLSVSTTFLWYQIVLTFSQLKAGLLFGYLLSGDSSVGHMRVTGRKLPFVFLDKGEEWSSVLPRARVACFGRPCLFETTIALLPRDTKHTCDRAQDMQDSEEQNLRILGDDKLRYLSSAPSLAVDGRPETAFRSLLSISLPYHRM